MRQTHLPICNAMNHERATQDTMVVKHRITIQIRAHPITDHSPSLCVIPLHYKGHSIMLYARFHDLQGKLGVQVGQDKCGCKARQGA